MDPEVFTGIYAEIAAEIDSETAVKVFEMLHGQTVSFPQKLYSRKYVRSFIRDNYEKYSVRELSGMFGYSDRRVRQFISEEREAKDET